MRCSTCGELLAAGDELCSVCGAAGTRLLSAPPSAVRRCPRCYYVGEGVGYFRRPGHLALLVGASLLTYGFGGLGYWLARRRHVVCPDCGLRWYGRGRVLARPSGPRSGALAGQAEEPLPSAGLKRRVLGIVVLLLAAVALVVGIVELEAAALGAGSVLGLGGSVTFLWGWRALQDRRAALTQAMERRVLQLATHRGGTLTVTEVAAELDLSLPAAERVLIGMDDGFRVRSDVTDEGILLFEFPEVRHRRPLPPA